MTDTGDGELWVPEDLKPEVELGPEPLAGTAPPTIYQSSNLTRFNPFPAARAAGTPLSNYEYMVSMHMTSHGMKRLPKVGVPPPPPISGSQP